MPLATINTYKSHGEPGTLEMHYGYICEVGPEGELTADIPDELIQGELDAKRVTLVEKKKAK